jgi:hypothetical protein
MDSKLAQLYAALDTATEDRQRLPILRDLLVHHELCERAERGLLLYHALTLDHLFFPFSRDLLLRLMEIAASEVARAPANGDALSTKVMAHFCDRADWSVLEPDVAKLRGQAGAHIWASVTFDLATFETCNRMGDADIVGTLPPMQTMMSLPVGGEPVIVLACNYPYFVGFCIPLLRSLAAHTAAAVHLHLMDFPSDKIAALNGLFQQLPNLQFGVTVENSGVPETQNARNYYHSIRFVRLYQLLHHYKRPLWLMDVDALFKRSPAAIFEQLKSSDVALRIRPGRLEPWNQFSACAVGIAPTRLGFAYLKSIAAFTAHSHKNGTIRWGFDQFAMYACHAVMKDPVSVTLLDNVLLDPDHNENGVLWLQGGSNKFSLFKRKTGEAISPAEESDESYVRLFDRYRT